MMTIERKGIICNEIAVDECEAQIRDADFVSSSPQLGYTETHYATDDYDVYVRTQDGVVIRAFSNRD